MKIIAMLNIKGGVAKTVSTVNVAVCMAKRGHKTLIIDLDPQANATKYLNKYEPKKPSSYNVLMGTRENVVVDTEYENLQMVPSNIDLIMAEPEILSDTRKARETRLRKFINNLKCEYDFIFIDCPPSLGMLSENALSAATDVMIPIKIDKFALDGFEYLVETISEIKDEFNPDLNILGAFVTMDKATTVNRDIKKDLKDALNDVFFDCSIRENVAVTKSTFKQVPVVINNPKSNAAKDYEKLSEEILRKC